IIVVSTLSVPMLLQWQNLDATWISRFYETAEEVEPDSISGLREMIRSEQETLNFERYWMGIISECDKKNEIYHYEATRKQLLLDLSIIDDKIKMAKEELAKIFNTNNVQSEINLISSQNSKNENNTNSGTISDLDFETSKSHQNRERIPTLTRDDINELGENQDDSVLQGIETSSTSQADECINTSTQDDDSYNASNNRSINLGVSSTRKSKEIMYSHARENTAIVDLAIEISRAQDNASIDAMELQTPAKANQL
ncbi:26325_t:CDS:2, partial [Gigaspora rosea]